MKKCLIATATLVILMNTGARAGQLPEAAAGRFQRAIDHFHSSRYREALRILGALEEQFPASVDVQHLLALVLDLTDQPREANRHFQKAVELAPDSTPIRVNYGTSLLRLGRHQEAISQFRRALELDSANATAAFNLGTLLLRQGELKEAERWLRAAYRIQPEVYENGYQLAFCWFLQGKHEAVRDLLSRLESLSARGAEFLLLRALVDRALGDQQRASEQLTELLPLLVRQEEAHELIVLLLLSQQMHAEAVPLLEKIARKNPESHSAWLNLARSRHESGQPQEARSAALEALSVRETAEVHVLLGRVAEALQKPLETVKHYRRAVDLDPSEANIFLLGYEFLSHWNWQTAEQVFESGLSRHPRSWRLWIGKGVAALAEERHEEATQAFLQAIEIEGLEMGYQLLARSFEKAEDSFEKAVACYLDLLRRRPGDRWAVYYDALARFHKSLRTSGDYPDEALSRLAATARQNPDFFEARYLLGEISFHLGRWRDAVMDLKEAVRLDPAHIQASYRLGLALRRAGRSEEARIELERYQTLKEQESREVAERMAATTRFIVKLKEQ